MLNLIAIAGELSETDYQYAFSMMFTHPSWLLGYADPTDQSNPSIQIVVISAGIALVAVILALLPICIAWKRRHRQSETIVPIGILWGLATAAVCIYAYITQANWAKERMARIMSGYYDPQDNSAAPALPWGFWLLLMAAYTILIVWSMANVPGTQLETAGDAVDGDIKK
jgi:hypothetical protein